MAPSPCSAISLIEIQLTLSPARHQQRQLAKKCEMFWGRVLPVLLAIFNAAPALNEEIYAGSRLAILADGPEGVYNILAYVGLQLAISVHAPLWRYSHRTGFQGFVLISAF